MPALAPYVFAMRLVAFSLTLLALLAMFCPDASAARSGRMASSPARHTGAKSIGRFAAWQAATYPESGSIVCYAFSRTTKSAPALRGRGDVVLTVTQRPKGRDTVAISAGFALAGRTDASVLVAGTRLGFYIAGRSAFARDHAAAVAAFTRADRAISTLPGPKGLQITDLFSLNGFAAAYAAINQACPPG